ncbi:MAG TPA: polyketide synthase dehydratase domain-containing protein, partial [Candidatus Acidoferrales bacterium]|nr:polyketide synthase dehydratase domain-containing protein [Candidatus Acidoferrales bacterium]
GEIPGASYWRLQISQGARLEAGLEALAAQGFGQTLEVGPRSGVSETARFRGPDAKIISLPSLDANRGGWQSMLGSLAALYVRGARVNWQAFDAPYQPFKVSLPTYPFERERCWEEPYTEPGAKKSAKPANALLGERVNSALPMPQFQSRIAVDTLRYLNDHRVQGSAVFPAAAYLEMGRAASAELFGAGSPVLSNVAFQEALILPATGSRSLQFVASPASSGSASFQIYSSNANLNGNHDAAAWTLHASGDMRMEVPDFARCAEEQFSLDEIRHRCSRRKTAAELYASLKNNGLEYGPGFQGVQHVWCGEREALGEINLPQAAGPICTTNGDADGVWFHPALLDSCLHVLAAALPEEAATSGRKMMYLPTAVESLRCLARPKARIFSHCRIRPGSSLGAEFVDADFRLLDDEGCVVGELLGFRVKLISGDTARDARENPGDLLFEVSWVAKKALGVRDLTASEPSPCFMVADRAGVAQELAAQLKSRGATCTVAGSDDLPAFKPGEVCTNVVYLPSLDSPEPGVGANAIEAAQSQWIAALKFVQKIARQAQGAKVRLWIVTRGAQSVGANATRIALAQTPLWGMAKSVDLEHAELGCTRIDLDPERDGEEMSALSQELLLSGSEHEVAFRRGTRYVARL